MRSFSTFWVEQEDPLSPEAVAIRRRQVETLGKRVPVVIAGNLVGSTLITAIVWQHTTIIVLAPWLALMWLMSLLRLWHWRRRGAAVAEDIVNQRDLTRSVVGSSVAGVLWGAAAAAFFNSGVALQDVFVIFVIGGMAAAAASYLAVLPLACIAFITFSMSPVIVKLGLTGDPVPVVMAAILVFYLAAMLFLARSSFADFVSRVRSDHENAALLDRLARASQELERRVEERTRELAASEQRATAERRRLIDAIEAFPDGIVIHDGEDRLILCNEQFRGMHGAIRDLLTPGIEFETLLRAGIERGLAPTAAGREEEWLSERLRRHRQPGKAFVERLAGDRWIRIEERHTAEGGTVGVRTDITRSMQQEAALRASEEQLRLVTDALPVTITYVDADQRYRFLNKTFEQWHKRPRSEALGRAMATVLSKPHYDSVRSAVEEVLSGKEARSEATLVHADGVTRRVQRIYIPHFSADNRVLGFFALVEDITAQRETEALLLLAQKNEAVGHLTGGIAHDFNNLLGIIIGNLELIEDRIAGDPVSLKLFKSTSRACLRGAELTNRLLAFARRQMLNPRVTDVNGLTAGLIELLRRTLEESIHIETALADDLRPAMIDPGQLENAIVNIAINARDAMQDGGNLLIETRNARLDETYSRKYPDVAPGWYVLIAITDTGAGMPAGVVARAFDPFFTTKEVGRGSGLGLSMVYGFIKQSGGHATIYTEVGHGTTVRMYLRRADGADAAPEAGEGDDTAHPTGSERILVVEDDAQLRDLAVSTLEALGYSVLMAGSGPAALDILDAGNHIDLLFTDVVMPGGMNGHELASQARQRVPGLRILLTSGYTPNAVLRQGTMEPGTQLIGKPYRKRELAAKVRAVLDELVARRPPKEPSGPSGTAITA